VEEKENGMSGDQQNAFIDNLRAQVSRMLDGLDQEEPIAATVVFNVSKATEDTFARNNEALAQATLKLPGVNVYAYHERRQTEGEPQGDNPEYLIYEDWETVRQFRKQWDSEHLKKFQFSVGDLIAGPPQLSWYYGWSDAGAAGGRVSKTGQKKCWGTSGSPIDCEGTGQDGELRIGAAWPTPRFSDNGDGTVTDHLTKLVWLKDADRFGEVTWEQALANANNLAGGSHGLSDGSKKGDWSLPNIKELFSLLDYGTGDPLIPHGHPFKNVKSSIYWTGTSLASSPSLAWMMTLAIGPTVFDLKINPNRMWPVRRGGKSRVPKTGQKTCWDSKGNVIDCAGTGQDGDVHAGAAWPDPRFQDNGDGTVTDNLTRLVWLKNANPFGFRTWQQALDDCNRVASGSHGLTDESKRGDWRLPNIKEIESLVDYEKFGPSLPDGGKPFVGVRPSSYWTSTSVAEAPSEAMFIILGVGPAIFESKEHAFFAWPVRDRRSRR
jgi:quinol monooxygenase YgiN